MLACHPGLVSRARPKAWYSIKQAVDIAAAEVKRGVDVVAAFSWGGGVACWLLADHPKREDLVPWPRNPHLRLLFPTCTPLVTER